MKCIKCGSEMFASETTEAVERKEGVIIIRKIPCFKCTTCSEIHYTGTVAKRLEEMIRETGVDEKEISVVYDNHAA